MALEPYTTNGTSDIVDTLTTALEQIPTIVSEMEAKGFETDVCEVSAGENMFVTVILAIDHPEYGLAFRTVVWTGDRWMEYS